MKNNLIVCAPVKNTGDYTHFVAYLKSGSVFSLIAPCSGPAEAKEVGMNYNSMASGLPPYTFKISRWGDINQHLKTYIKFTLGKMNVKGKLTLYKLTGYHELPIIL